MAGWESALAWKNRLMAQVAAGAVVTVDGAVVADVRQAKREESWYGTHYVDETGTHEVERPTAKLPSKFQIDMPARWAKKEGDDPIDSLRSADLDREVYGVLNTADTFYWTPDIYRQVNMASQSLPDWAKIEYSDLPSVSGFYWLGDVPVEGWREFQGRLTGSHGFDWQEGKALESEVTAIAYSAAGGDASLEYVEPQALSKVTTGLNIYVHYRWMHLDPVNGDHYHNGNFASHTFDFGMTLKEYDQLCFDAFGGNETDLKIVTTAIRFVLGSFAFLSQKLVTADIPPMDRHTRRRLTREYKGEIPEIRVINLRKRQHRETDTVEGHPVDWSCQWWVDGHWANQWYPSEKTHKRIWIMPYIKGPEDKPLHAKPVTVYAVNR